MAVAELRRLFKSPAATRRVLHCPCKTIVERESTRPIPPMSQLVRRALKLIRERAAQGLAPADVADALGVSRRLLDMRLTQTENATLHELIARARLDAVARELKKSRLTIRAVAKKLGYGDIKRLEQESKRPEQLTESPSQTLLSFGFLLVLSHIHHRKSMEMRTVSNKSNVSLRAMDVPYAGVAIP